MDTALAAEPLLSLAVTVTSEQRVESVLRNIVQGLASQPGVALTRIWLLPSTDLCGPGQEPLRSPEQTECLHLVASAGSAVNSPGEDWSFLQGHFSRLPLNVGKVGQVAATRNPIRINDLGPQNDWILRPEWAKREGIRSFAGLPLIFRDNLLGVIGLFSRKPITEQEFTWLGLFANQAAVAIANARAFEEVDRLRCQLEGERDYLQEQVAERKQAEEALRQAQADLAHANRVSSLGELTASLAHEVKQPIAATITNADNCLLWLSRGQPDLEKARAAASRIAQDGRRAVEIVDRVRLLFKKGTLERELVDLNETIRDDASPAQRGNEIRCISSDGTRCRPPSGHGRSRATATGVDEPHDEQHRCDEGCGGDARAHRPIAARRGRVGDDFSERHGRGPSTAAG